VKAATRTGKKKNALTPMTFSLLHATDFADRLLYKIVPPLKAGMIVLADRYAYTAFARDATRGVDRQWVRELYSFAVRPDMTLYFKVPIDVSVDRLLARRHTVPELLFGLQELELVEPVSSNLDHLVLVIAEDDREYPTLRPCLRHIVLELGHVAFENFFALGKGAGVLSLPNGSGSFDKSVDGTIAPRVPGALDDLANALNRMARDDLIPLAVERLGPIAKRDPQDA
jgi:hypothetical protein